MMNQNRGQTGLSPFPAATQQRQFHLAGNRLRASSDVPPSAHQALARWNVPEPQRTPPTPAAVPCECTGVAPLRQSQILPPRDARAILLPSSVFAIAPFPAEPPA